MGSQQGASGCMNSGTVVSSSSPHEFIEALHILDNKANLHFEITDVVLKRLIFSDAFHDLLSQPFHFDFFLEVGLGIIQEMDKILDSADGYIRAHGELPILLPSLLGTEKGLNLDECTEVGPEVAQLVPEGSAL
jgi:hypothetical protein